MSYHAQYLIRLTVAVFLLCPTSVFAQDADSVATDSLLIADLARQLEAGPSQDQARARGNQMNPEISVIGDFRASYISSGKRNIDTEMHEVETAFRSAVDPYARADVYVSMHRDGGEFAFELEEAYLTTLSLPYQLQLKAGKFRSGFGKINRIHPHALPYVELPSAYINYFGEDGLNDQGISLSWLLPNPRFFQELIVEATRGPAESESFAFSGSNRLLYTGRLRNFWDLSPNTTLEFGLSGATGQNDEGGTTLLGGIDLTYIWKPLQFNVYRSLSLQGELILGRKESDAATTETWGGYALAEYRFARRWQVTVRADMSDLPDDPSWDENAQSVTLGWLATEFQKIELGVRTWEAATVDRRVEAVVRAVFVIGSHGAHEY